MGGIPVNTNGQVQWPNDLIDGFFARPVSQYMEQID